MRHFVDAVFTARQHTPVGDQIDPASLMRSTNCVASSLKRLGPDNRKEYKGFLLDDMYQKGGGVTTKKGKQVPHFHRAKEHNGRNN